MMKLLLFPLVFSATALLCIDNVQSLRILGVFPPFAKSHHILASGLMKGLAERGHNVTIITPFAEKEKIKNYNEVILTGIVERAQAVVSQGNLIDKMNKHPLAMIVFILTHFIDYPEETILHENVQKLLKADEKFDVVIVEEFMNHAHKAFAAHYDAPLVLFSTVGANSWFNPLVGNPQPLSYVTEVMLGYSGEMNFWQRLDNVITWTINMLAHNLYVYPHQRRVAKRHFPNVDFDKQLYNSSIVLVNSHPSTNLPVPSVPNMIEIGGFHVQPSKKLPQDLQTFLDNAKDGVIYFSFGSNIKSSQLPEEKRDALIKVFSKLKQKVLWKWEVDELPGQPANLKISKWFPQQDILAHPNVKLFITHGGLLSTTETVYHGVPTLAVPFFADQKMNAQHIVDNKIGLTMSFLELNERNLEEKLQELLNNPIYTKNAKLRSQLFHDRPQKPMDTAAYWVEYVARHRGASHLRVAGVDLPFYKYMLLDVVAFLGAVSLIAAYLTYKFWAFVFKLCLRKKVSGAAQKSKKLKKT